MVDMRLFTHRIILSGVMMAMTALITLVGFELLMAQELQFVHQKTPFEAGIFMLPVMVASGFSGPIAGLLVSRLGLREVATGGMLLSAFSFLGLALTDFSTQQWLAWGLMTLLGFSVASALLASSSAIMAAAPKEKAAAAGAIETMAYELGAGLGIALFRPDPDPQLQRLYCAAVWPEWRHGAAGGVIDWRGGESVPGAARRGGAGADGGGEDGFYSGS